MDSVFCINGNSFPAQDIHSACNLFDDALQGVLEVCDGGRAIFYYDSINEQPLLDLVLAPGFTYKDFLERHTDHDLKTFLYEVEDKSPALASLSDDQIDEMAAYSFYIPSESMLPTPDDLSLTHTMSGYLLSLRTSAIWDEHTIIVSRTDSKNRYVDEKLSLRNISKFQHGVFHRESRDSFDVSVFLSPTVVSDEFIHWLETITTENRNRVYAKLKDAKALGFSGGEPLFKTLKSSDGMRELRFSASSGGAIRILFKHLGHSQYAILNGFIKFSNSEGYDTEISKAELILKRLHS